LEGRHLFFFANKLKKAAIIQAALSGPVTEDVPASVLQRHPNVSVVLDLGAASLLPAEYPRAKLRPGLIEGWHNQVKALENTEQFRNWLTRRRVEGLTVAINLMDLGAEIVDGRVIYRESLKKATQLLYLLAEYGVSGVYLYGGLYETSELSKELHQVSTTQRSFITSGNATVTVANYATKRQIVDGVELKDSFGNAFSIYNLLRFNQELSETDSQADLLHLE